MGSDPNSISSEYFYTLDYLTDDENRRFDALERQRGRIWLDALSDKPDFDQQRYDLEEAALKEAVEAYRDLSLEREMAAMSEWFDATYEDDDWYFVDMEPEWIDVNMVFHSDTHGRQWIYDQARGRLLEQLETVSPESIAPVDVVRFPTMVRYALMPAADAFFTRMKLDRWVKPIRREEEAEPLPSAS